MEISQSGLWVFRASRLEALLAPLDGLLRAAPPEGVLAPQRIIAAHPGMRHWLLGELARLRGPRGIVANLEVRLPSTWLDELALSVLGAEAVAVKPYRRAVLRWHIHALLDALPDAAVADYLDGADGGRRRLQLADRLARVYSQYLVYRPDWLAGWARDADAAPVHPLLGALWHRLRARIDAPHRGERMRRLLEALHEGRGHMPAEPLHVFGVSHLAPSELQVLRAVARRRLVVLYLPDPCREYWGGLPDPRQALADQLRLEPFSGEAEAWFFEGGSGHPLLARWGRLGQHFVMALQDDGDGVAIDERHWQDQPEADAVPPHRLGRLQESIRRLQPALLAPPPGGDDPEDASLRVHACHTRLRELEVLRDQLLDAMASLDGLKPSDIVVMAPDIRAYVPLMPAVFGAPGDPEAVLPYHLADVPLASTHPVFTAFARLLSLPGARLTAPGLVDLLGEPAVARRLGLEGEDIERVTRWLGQARVAWALDAGDRERLGVPGIDAHTFAWGIDRMLAGHVFGDLAEDGGGGVELADGTVLAPLAVAAGPQAAVLGRVDRLLRGLAAWMRTCRGTHRASAWARRLAWHVDEMLAVDPRDDAAADAIAELKRCIVSLGRDPGEAGLDPELDFGVVRELLSEALGAVPERQRFLMGGMTVCGMVPQRAIPFRVVAVLGLNDGEFPRVTRDGGLDLMATLRRLGDRDVRSDDRYLFLETLMSARDRVHLGFIGEGVRDAKPRNPAMPLAELMSALDEAAGRDPDDHRAPRPWLVRHPLQPFDRRYFSDSPAGDAAPPLFSFSTADCRMAGRGGTPPAPFLAAPGDGQPVAAPGDDAARSVPLREVLAYYKDPARQVLAQRLRIRLDALEDDGLADSEPLGDALEAVDRVGRRLFFDAVHGGATSLADGPPDWLRLGGMLPPGRPGAAAWQRERAQVERLLERARTHPLFADGALPARGTVRLVAEVGGWRVGGELTRVHATPGAAWVVEAAIPKLDGKGTLTRVHEQDVGFRDRLPLFIEWALLRLHSPPGTAARLCLLCVEPDTPWQDAINAWDNRYVAADAPVQAAMRAGLGARVGELVGIWAASQVEPTWYFPRTSWLAAHAGDDEDASSSNRASDPAIAFVGSEGEHGSRGERDYAPGYARLLAGERRFEAGGPDRALLDAVARRLAGLIDLGETTEAGA